jgi:hypothetical protein
MILRLLQGPEEVADRACWHQFLVLLGTREEFSR